MNKIRTYNFLLLSLAFCVAIQPDYEGSINRSIAILVAAFAALILYLVFDFHDDE